MVPDGKLSFKKRPNKELYQHVETLEETIIKRRLKFYGHMTRMDENRLNWQIFNAAKQIKSMPGILKKQTGENSKFQINDTDCMDRRCYMKRIYDFRIVHTRASSP